MPRPPARSFRFTDEDVRLIQTLAERLTRRTDVHHTQTDVMRLAIRQLARREGITSRGGKKPG